MLKERWVTFPGDSYLMKIFTKVCGFQQPFAGDIQTTSLDQLLWITQASLFNTVVTKSILKTHKTKQLTPIHSKHPIDLNLGLVFNKKAIKKKHLKNFIAEWQKFLAKADYSSRLKENEY